MQLKRTPVLVSLIPNLMRGEGHIIPYHIAVSKAANLLQWQHLVVFPTDASVKELPSNWYGGLRGASLEDKIHPLQRILNLYQIWQLSITIVDFIRAKAWPSGTQTIIFMERFIHLQLLALLIALCLVPKRKITVWLLYRRDIHQDKTAWIYKLIIKSIKFILVPGRLHILTDSELLSQSLGSYFQEPLTVMPIPHTDKITFTNIPKNRQQIICWWPGIPRYEKGCEQIKSLTRVGNSCAERICLVAAKNSDIVPIKGGVKVKLVEDHLSEKEYLNWLENSDIILLPYNTFAYKERTSGIFTEGAIAGKILLVTAGTWMARELMKYGLEELIINWEQPESVLERIIATAASEELQVKIKAMQAAYQSFHSIENYAHLMQQLFEATENSEYKQLDSTFSHPKL